MKQIKLWPKGFLIAGFTLSIIGILIIFLRGFNASNPDGVLMCWIGILFEFISVILIFRKSEKEVKK
jgi:drug/metabolite transporter (DMT)-like permease